MGSRFIQRFEVLAELGSGGMGTVYRARDPQLDREVAIKVLKQTTAPLRETLVSRKTINLRDDDTARDDLLHEARVMARLAHPNVVPVYEVGIDGREVFVVMELVPGSDLREWLRAPHSRQAIAGVLAQAGHGLAAAHARGIVHRDFKPENVLIGEDGRARVADFGIAKLGATAELVRDPDLAGTPRYMAPELWKGAPASVASDVFAYCTVVDEVLGLSIEGGLAEDPAKRPGMLQIVRALDRRPRRKIVIGALAAAVVGTIATSAVVLGTRDACEPDDGLFAGRWDGEAREALRQQVLVGSLTEDMTFDRIERQLDARRAWIIEHRVAACESHSQGILSDLDHAKREACHQRRAMQIGAFVHHQLHGHPDDRALIEERAANLPRPELCIDIEAPPMRDPVVAGELYDRLDVATDGPELAAIEAKALAADEQEVAARAALALGRWNVDRSQLDAADQALQRAASRAHDQHDVEVEIQAVGERAALAHLRGDAVLATRLTGLAHELGARVRTPPQIRGLAYLQLGRAAKKRGDLPGAADELQAGLDTAGFDEQSLFVTVALQRELIDVLADLGRGARAVELATHSLTYIRSYHGYRSLTYALQLAARAHAYQSDHQGELAIRDARESLELLRDILPAKHAAVVAGATQLAQLSRQP